MAAEATSSCTVTHSMPGNASRMKICSNCDLLEGGACNASEDHDYIALEAKISAARTNQALENLISEQPDMRTPFNQNHDLLTTRLPPELIYAVFQFCIPEKWSFDDFRLKDANPKSGNKQIISAPILLGSICRSWRNIAWGLKSLWTIFTLDLTRLKNPEYITLTREWLDRAGQSRLSISIRNAPYTLSAQDDVEIAAQLFALVNERSEQWEYLDMASSSGWIKRLLKDDLGSAPNLRALKVAELYYEGLPLRGSQPRLRYLYLRNIYYIEPIKIKWDNITHVCLLHIILDSFFDLLRRAPNLVECKASIEPESLEDDVVIPAVSTIHQSLLATLEFSCFFDPEDQPEHPVATLFKSFVFPNLKHLNIRDAADPGCAEPNNVILWERMVTNIANSCTLLLSLTILHPGLHRSIIPILRRTPLLRELELFGPVNAGDEWEFWEGEDESEEIIENELFRLLADTSIVADNNTQPAFLPNLRSIKFHLYGDEFQDTFWNTISGIFGPISEIHNPRRRPLTTLWVRDEVGTHNPAQLTIKSKAAVLELLRLRQAGVVLDLKSLDEKMDLLEYAIEEHGLRDWSDGDPEPH